ncbi:acyl-CoA dehydrogenase [Mycolicibacterium moriokaense]|uniref:Acyl-CoA dehydrogenase n=1 Tax=Mycolicibacterium moriokaense TaxID=39691 RepID=A0AAD1HGI6_9MYCO|nr:acyl-CoA dehydrogenase family protein [Mycolicibacterium moriokaense]MCV7042185.1 acyl-CoA dehydrogenase family protein [Mycolicibacterium moriokaense]ORB19037.1 acyl-CoA dehydrogenase [Mycolicibacterium moriokaense]BBX04957.1 acyl-CoA dehydrogenase [Mycolicibacterium moriokaense]
MSEFDALCANEPELAKLRTSIREFLVADREEFGWRPSVDAWLSHWDEAFSARLGDAGYLGLTIPPEYGGRGLSHLHRYVVTEELLVAGAPVAAHWIADRQVAPALLSYGNDEQRQRILPRIAAGRFFSAIGMSEPGAGSDLAACATRATRVDGGWVLNGRKTWTSGAHHAHQIVVLARTASLDPETRHAGFSQFLVSTDSAGLTIDPIVMMDGQHHFNETSFEDVFVADADVLGELGNGWHQVTSELSFERSGPERILSTTALILAAIEMLATSGDVEGRTQGAVGELLARLLSLRQLSVSVARVLSTGGSAANQAALVKDLGTRFEQDSVELVRELIDYRDGTEPLTSELQALLNSATLHSPLFTLRGGTNEVLRGVVARGMGLR